MAYRLLQEDKRGLWSDQYCLYNNAGISSKNEEQEEEWDKEVDVNLVGRIGNLLWFITLLGLFLFLQILFLNLRFLSDFS